MDNKYKMLNMFSISKLQPSVLDIDSVQERSKILVLDHCGLLNPSAELRNVFQINALNSHVILLFFLL